MHAESNERRHTYRVNLAQVMRIRPFDPDLPPEYCTAANLSHDGLYFTTSAGHYAPGMRVYVTSDYQPGSPMDRSVIGVVVRVEKMEGGLWGVAIHILPPASSTDG
jgi:hypothetical protein